MPQRATPESESAAPYASNCGYYWAVALVAGLPTAQEPRRTEGALKTESHRGRAAIRSNWRQMP